MKKYALAGCCIFYLFILSRCWQHNNGGAVTVNEGAVLFNQYCATCHLNAGQGGPSPVPGYHAPDLREQTKTQQELIQIISNGFGKMPEFKDSTSDENITMIAAYVASNIEKHPGDSVTQVKNY